MPKTYLEVKHAVELCFSGRERCCDCPYWPYAACMDKLHADVLYWLDELEPRREGVSKPGGGLLE